jgi:twitching motility protein PilT
VDAAVSWFCYYSVERHLISAEQCRELRDAFGAEVDLITFAQAVLDHQMCDDVDSIQQIMDDAHTNAEVGSSPPRDVFEDGLDTGAATGAEGADDSLELVVNEPIGAAAVGGTSPPPPESSPSPMGSPMSMGASAGDLPSLDGVENMTDSEVGDIVRQFLTVCRGMGASDLHLSAMAIPFVRLNLQIKTVADKPLSPEASARLNTVLLSESQSAEFDAHKDLDFGLAVPDSGRFRVNLMVHKQGVAGTYRLVPDRIMSLVELGFRDTKTITNLLDHHNGLILVTGPVGSGKTTTLAALVDIINSKREDHIITVEEPIEIVHQSKKCNVTQREVGPHTRSFASALKGALREDPDVIVIGELRDLETIEMAITAAETGHLVIGTLHTSDAATTLDRLLDVFPPDQQQQIRAMTAESLRGIICQKLIPRDVVNGLAVASEILIHTIAVANIIREGKTHTLAAVLQTGAQQGMQLMDQSVFELWEDGSISQENALMHLKDKQFINRILNPAATGASEKSAEPASMPSTAGSKKKGGWFK